MARLNLHRIVIEGWAIECRRAPLPVEWDPGPVGREVGRPTNIDMAQEARDRQGQTGEEDFVVSGSRHPGNPAVQATVETRRRAAYGRADVNVRVGHSIAGAVHVDLRIPDRKCCARGKVLELTVAVEPKYGAGGCVIAEALADSCGSAGARGGRNGDREGLGGLEIVAVTYLEQRIAGARGRGNAGYYTTGGQC